MEQPTCPIIFTEIDEEGNDIIPEEDLIPHDQLIELTGGDTFYVRKLIDE